MIAPIKRKSFSNRLDGWIFNLFPKWGTNRLASRKKLDLIDYAAKMTKERLNSWEAADNDRFRGHKWLVSRLSPNDAIEDDWENLVYRSEDLYKNDAFAASAINGRVKNVIGCGINYQSRIMPLETIDENGREVVVVDDKRARELNKQLEMKYRIWAKKDRFVQKQKLFERSKGIYGEAFAIKSSNPLQDTIPLTIQIISPLRVSTPPNKEGDPDIRLGIEFDPKTNDPVAYFVQTSHPDDSKDSEFDWERILAERMIHSFTPLFPGQIRGVPWLAPAMTDLKDLKDFKEAHILSEQVAACFSAFVESTGNPFDDAVNNTTETTSDGKRLEDLEPGIVQYLKPGQTVKFSDPNRPGGTLEPFMDWHLRAVSAAIDFPFELLVKKYENSYSGGRLAVIDGRISFQCWQDEVIHDLCDSVGRQLILECVAVGEVDIDADEFLQHREHFSKHAWVAPGWPWVDPVKEVRADTEAIHEGLGTRQDSLNTRGKDLEETDEQRFREKSSELEMQAKLLKRKQELEEEFGISFGSDSEEIGNEADNPDASEVAEEVAELLETR